MKVSELIDALNKLPQDADVGLLWDGGYLSDAEATWLSKRGNVLIGPLFDYVYDLEDRPVDAQHSDNRYVHVWEMLGLPEPIEED